MLRKDKLLFKNTQMILDFSRNRSAAYRICKTNRIERHLYRCNISPSMASIRLLNYRHSHIGCLWFVFSSYICIHLTAKVLVSIITIFIHIIRNGWICCQHAVKLSRSPLFPSFVGPSMNRYTSSIEPFTRYQKYWVVISLELRITWYSLTHNATQE